MAFPDAGTFTNDGAAAAALTSRSAAAGLDLSGLSPIAQLQSAVANLLVSDPSTVNVPAGDVLSGTFGANKSGGADTGTYTFPGALTITGALAGVTSATFSARLTSTTALATPGALVATTATVFASTVSGGVLMGFGTTNDVSLMNRAGTVVLGVGPNTTLVNIPGTLLVTGLTTLGGSAVASGVVIDGTGFGAGVASLRLNGLTTAVTNNLVGTLTNSPVTGNPTFWAPISIAGVIKYLPLF